MLNIFLKLLRQTTVNSTNNCAFLRFIISVSGSHCDYSLQVQKKSYTNVHCDSITKHMQLIFLL
jgi:hypothetical protein